MSDKPKQVHKPKQAHKPKQVHKPSRSRRRKPVAASDRAILRALLRSTVEREGAGGESLVWQMLAFDATALERELIELAKPTSAPAKRRLHAFAQEFAERYALRVSLSDDIPLPFGGDKARLPRWLMGQALGALGTNLLPTRRRIRRTATEAARELAYFGYGRLGDQVLPHPIALVRGALEGRQQLVLDPVLLDEQDRSLGRRWTAFELLAADEFFHRELDSEAELARFQQRLREDPLDGNMVVKLRGFFSRRATVGIRDTSRWVLGSRHPWFGWQRARRLIADCFERWGTESFLTRRVTLFHYDADLDDDELGAALAVNEEAVRVFAGRLGERLSASVRSRLADDELVQLARAALDCHHDHPDFDLEAKDRQGGETTAEFFSHALYLLLAQASEKQPRPRRNVNLRAHFIDKGAESRWLAGLDEAERESFYLALGKLLKDYRERNGVVDGGGHVHVFERIPLVAYTFFESARPRPRPGERVQDSFRLSALREPQHAHQLKRHPEVFEKLVVFFTLVLRHFLDTEHVPNLRPENLMRDLLLLGLWGTNTPNLVIHLFENEKTGKVRSEVRFLGRSQVKGYQPDEDRKYEAALARLLISLFGPLLEPSMLRCVGAFVMAAEESTQGSRVQEMGPVALAKHGLELFREAARIGIKGSLVDLATLLEMLVDNSVDIAQRGLDRMAKAGGVIVRRRR